MPGGHGKGSFSRVPGWLVRIGEMSVKHQASCLVWDLCDVRVLRLYPRLNEVHAWGDPGAPSKLMRKVRLPTELLVCLNGIIAKECG